MDENRLVVRMLVRSREDFQAMRKKNDNRLGMKADGTEQVNLTSRSFSPKHAEMFAEISDAARAQEKAIEKKLLKVLREFPIYESWLKNVKGVGTISAGWIVGEFDIRVADTVSKLWQFAGLNPGEVIGKKSVSLADAEKSGARIVKTFENQGGEKCAIIVTDTLIRGDKLTPGFVAPFNKRLRVALCGVLADSFIKQRAPYRTFYDDYKLRLENSEREVEERTGGGKSKMVEWREAKKSHRHRAAIRYMIKAFLRDLYENWREMEELPVRPPYQEEYLGHEHVA